MKRFLSTLLRWLYGYRAFNPEVLETKGPVLLIPNHSSWFDWLFLLAELDGDWKFVTSSVTARKSWFHTFFMVNKRTFPIDTSSPYAVKRMAEFLQGGGRLVLFAEGRISRTGSLMKLFDGTGFLLHKTAAKVITCYLRGAKRLPLSPNQESKKWLLTVTAHYSEVLTAPKVEHVSTMAARTKLTNWLRDRMVNQQFATEMEFGPKVVPEAIAATAAAFPGRVILQDAMTTELTYRKLLVGASLLADQLGGSQGNGLLQKQAPVIHAKSAVMPEGWMKDAALESSDSGHLGILLPNVNAMPVTLLAVWATGKIPAVLNFSTGPAVMLQCCQLADLKQVITSKLFIEKAKLNLQPLTEAGIEFVYLEDLRAGIGKLAKLGRLLRSYFGLRSLMTTPLTFNTYPDRTAVILFTSGSEGVPKGVELTHANLLANMRQMLAITDLTDQDRLFNSLPMFHSFGLTVGTLLPLVRGMFCFVYPSPLHYRIVPAAFYDRDCTVMLGTNTFLNGYARKAHTYDFRSLRYLFAAAEKVQSTTFETWAQKYGVRILEGYGATECSPCVSVCTPLQPKHGTTGRLMPGMEYRLEPVEGVGEQPDPGSQMPDAGKAHPGSVIGHQVSAPAAGRLFVRGPNVMKGYLNADANAKFLALDGWYDTGDIVSIDEEGFVKIQGRMKRFAKVSGEMVSLTAVEDALAGAFPHYGLRCQIAVIAVPDADKGERLIAISNEPKLSLDEIRTTIKAKGLTNLCVPREVKSVREIPKLGTGKVNHRELLAKLKEL
jgi:acyl-[acyl-carrier-protein]-phospholipid O-acyltransferase/long-chain-fatty-acid--[acyl-carrier-protein] ligase